VTVDAHCCVCGRLAPPPDSPLYSITGWERTPPQFRDEVDEVLCPDCAAKDVEKNASWAVWPDHTNN
jgi:hypothetical protein